MPLTPLKNTLSKKNHSKSVVLYSSCCCCCCCILAPVGSYITEKTMSNAYPYRQAFWGHVIKNFLIGLFGVIVSLILWFTSAAYFRNHIVVTSVGTAILAFSGMYALFYLSSNWLNKDLAKIERIKAVFLQTLLTCILGGVLFVASIYLVFAVLS